MYGASETLPRLGFRPTNPQHAAGIRIDPPASEALATARTPDATAAAAPPEEPPGVCSGLQGLRTGPKRTGSVIGSSPNSQLRGVPISGMPAAFGRAAAVLSTSGTKSPNRREPQVSGIPAEAKARSLTAYGTPVSAPAAEPSSAILAAASAPSASRCANGPSDAWARSAEISVASVSSRAVSSPRLIAAACSVAGRSSAVIAPPLVFLHLEKFHSGTYQCPQQPARPETPCSGPSRSEPRRPATASSAQRSSCSPRAGAGRLPTVPSRSGLGPLTVPPVTTSPTATS